MPNKVIRFNGYAIDLTDGDLSVRRGEPIVQALDQDYGTDPVYDEDGNPTGKVTLHPSGRGPMSLADAMQILGR